MTTSPHNPLFLLLFLGALGGFFESILRFLKIPFDISLIVTACLEGLVILRLFQMANTINILLVLAVGICFVSFAKNMN